MKTTTFHKRFLLFTTLVVGMCSIIYELLISTVSSYFLGDSVKQFSIIIGFYLAFMGLGSWLSRFFKKDVLFSFIWVEIILGIIGAFSIPLCYVYFSLADSSGFNIFILGLVALIGTITGLEVPMLTSLLQDGRLEIKEELSDVLTLDYLGALIATIIFPFILIPFMGVYKSSLLFGFINIAIGLSNYIIFRNHLKTERSRDLIIWTVISAFMGLILLAGVRANDYMRYWNNSIFKHQVIYDDASPYQNIIMTDNGKEFRLYLNSAIQFSSRDEYRYHEALVHVPAMQISDLKKVVVLGGGEGLAARELLKYTSIDSIFIIELDPEISRLSSENGMIRDLNEAALLDERVKVINEDALVWLKDSRSQFDLIIADLPDPNNESLSRLYSTSFFQLVERKLTQGGLFVTQATSPELSPNAFWCIDKTIGESGFRYTYPYHINVPSFGNWGFVVGSRKEVDFGFDDSVDLKFIESDIFQHIFYFPPDILRDKVEINRLDQPIIMNYYLDHWRSLNSEPK